MLLTTLLAVMATLATAFNFTNTTTTSCSLSPTGIATHMVQREEIYNSAAIEHGSTLPGADDVRQTLPPPQNTL